MSRYLIALRKMDFRLLPQARGIIAVSLFRPSVGAIGRNDNPSRGNARIATCRKGGTVGGELLGLRFEEGLGYVAGREDVMVSRSQGEPGRSDATARGRNDQLFGRPSGLSTIAAI